MADKYVESHIAIHIEAVLSIQDDPFLRGHLFYGYSYFYDQSHLYVPVSSSQLVATCMSGLIL